MHADSHNVKLRFIQPGKPTQNAYIESFNGKFRDECLNDNVFVILHNAQKIIETWRQDYNSERPHSSLNGMAPTEFAKTFEKEQITRRSLPFLARSAGIDLFSIHRLNLRRLELELDRIQSEFF